MKLTKRINDSAKRSVERSLSRISNMLGEKGQGLVDELRGIFDEMESSEVEVSNEELANAIKEVLGKYEEEKGAEVPAPIAEALGKMREDIAKVRNGVNASEKGKRLPVSVKNQVVSAIIGCRSKNEVKDAVEKVLVKNDITGLTFADVISYEIVDNWGDEQGFYGELQQVPYNKFFYNDDDLTEAAILAKQWDKNSEAAKAVQTIATDGKTITTKYIYKKQRISNEDIDAIREAGEESNFVNYITNELHRQWCNSVVKAMLVGDTTNQSGSRISTFEGIGTKTASDVFTTIKNPEGATLVFGDLWKTCQSIKNPDGKKVTLFIDPAALEAIAAFTFAAGGTEDFRGLDELKLKLGVDEIRKYDLHTYSDSKIHAVAIIGDGYWVKEKGGNEIAYPDWDMNVQQWLFEKNAGGAIHDILSTAVLREA